MDSTELQATLSTIIDELKALKLSNAELVQRITALEERVATLQMERPAAQADRILAQGPSASAGETVSQGGRTSRRVLLRRAAGAAVASVAAGAMLKRDTDTASADHQGTTTTEVSYRFVKANEVQAHYISGSNDSWPPIYGTTGSSEDPGVMGRNFSTGPGVKGFSNYNTGPGVVGIGNNGVQGESANSGASGVYGENKGGGFGVAGDTTGTNGTSWFTKRAGVYGRNKGTGPGVMGASLNASGNGIGTGDGVYGEGKTGVHGRSATIGVHGEASGTGNGLRGTSVSGYGAQLQGGKAPLRLMPAGIIGRPTTGTHYIGELFLDKNATLWICTASTSTTNPHGVWKRITMS